MPYRQVRSYQNALAQTRIFVEDSWLVDIGLRLVGRAKPGDRLFIHSLITSGRLLHTIHHQHIRSLLVLSINSKLVHPLRLLWVLDIKYLNLVREALL